jgi:hypothetical protein
MAARRRLRCTRSTRTRTRTPEPHPRKRELHIYRRRRARSTTQNRSRLPQVVHGPPEHERARSKRMGARTVELQRLAHIPSRPVVHSRHYTQGAHTKLGEKKVESGKKREKKALRLEKDAPRASRACTADADGYLLHTSKPKPTPDLHVRIRLAYHGTAG